MRILAIETSCDETGVAILDGVKNSESVAFAVRGSALLSQAAMHAEFGGVFPTLAKREHLKNLPLMLEEAVRAASSQSPEKKSSGLLASQGQTVFSGNCDSAFAALQIDAIAVTSGPGLEPALWTGITFAQELAKKWNLPLIPVNHLEGHLMSSLVKDNIIENVALPVLGLVISGGHTELVLMKEWFVYEKIGQTLDDAVGEAFDKVARMLNLPYPGGPHISRLAHRSRTAQAEEVKRGLSSATAREPSQFSAENSRTTLDFPPRATDFTITLPRPMLHSDNCDVSFSGLKTAALYKLRDLGGIEKLSESEVARFAQEFEDATADVLCAKTKRALQKTGTETFVIGGGVAANSHIRTRLAQMIERDFPDVAVCLPGVSLTGDNAIMIAMTALLRSLAGAAIIPAPESIRADGNLSL